jgi:hypothetical protein
MWKNVAEPDTCTTDNNIRRMRFAYRISNTVDTHSEYGDCVWNVMAQAQKQDFFFRQNGRVHLNRKGGQFSRILAGELCKSGSNVCTARASLCSAVMWRLLVTHSILLFPFTSPPVRHRVPSHFNWTLNSYCFSTTRVDTRKRLNIILHVHCLYCFSIAIYTVLIDNIYIISPRFHVQIVPLYRQWGSVQALRPIGGVEV